MSADSGPNRCRCRYESLLSRCVACPHRWFDLRREHGDPLPTSALCEHWLPLIAYSTFSVLRKSGVAASTGFRHTVEDHLVGICRNSVRAQHCTFGNAEPCGIVHCTFDELLSEHAWRRVPTAVAGTLIHGDDLD